MACFLVPAAEAIVVTIAEKVEAKKERKAAVPAEIPAEQYSDSVRETVQERNEYALNDTASKSFRIPLSRKLRWLSSLLWGGAVLLAFEHLWHGEVIPWFPFLSALADTEGTMGMLHEMATVGVGMAVLITVVWGGICLAADRIASRPPAEEAEKNPA